MNEKPKSVFKQEITLGQAVGFILTICTIIFSAWINTRVAVVQMQTELTILKERNSKVENNIQENQSYLIKSIGDIKDLFYKQQADIRDMVNQMKVELQNKKDKGR